MLELICAIPEEIGWLMCGVAGGACVNMFIKLVRIIVEMIKDRLEDNEKIIEENA